MRKFLPLLALVAGGASADEGMWTVDNFPADRVAAFDNDGTLWVEYPMYTQVLFAFERVKELAPQHPEWKTTQPFQAVLEDDMEALAEALPTVMKKALRLGLSA